MMSLFFGGQQDANIQLQKLRTCPREVGEEMDRTSKMFVVDMHEAYTRRREGGACQIACRRLGGGTYGLTPHSLSGTDYYYPYVQQGSPSADGTLGVGHCRVPSAAPDGTIVLTGGMNGCSLDVCQSGSDLIFRHDANGRSMPELNRSERRLFRLDARSYSIGNVDYNYAIRSMSASPGSMAMGKHFFLSVKARGEWVVLHSAVLESSTGKKTRYEPLPTIAHVSGSFK